MINLGDSVGIFAISISFYLCLFFFISALPKIRDFSSFKQIIEGYDLLAPEIIPIAGKLVIVIELLTSVLLLVPNIRSLSLAVSGMILLVYAIVALLVIMRGGSGIPCGCGPRTRVVNFSLVSKNIFIAAIVLAISCLHSASEHILVEDVILGLLGIIVFAVEQTIVQLRLNAENGVVRFRGDATP